MKPQVEAAKAARRLWRTEGRVGSVAAVLLVVAFFGWPLYRFWRTSRGDGR